MPPLLMSPDAAAVAHLVGAGLLAALGVCYLLPRPRGRSAFFGGFLALGGLVLAAAFVATRFGEPTSDVVGSVLFWLFSAGALGFGVVLVTQRNPARGAIAFAFVVLSSCGLFLLLAAPFLMAATVIIYAGAIIVTFLFVLMLSHAGGPSAENDRTREPLLGSLAGFGFAGLVLFTLHQSAPAAGGRTLAPLPIPPLTADERTALTEVADRLKAAESAGRAELVADEFTRATRDRLEQVAGGQMQARLKPAAADARVAEQIARADALKARTRAAFDAVDNALLANPPDEAKARAALAGLREDVVVLSGAGRLPARNVGTIGMVLYSEHLLAVELAGTLLLVATIGAVAIANRRGVAA